MSNLLLYVILSVGLFSFASFDYLNENYFAYASHLTMNSAEITSTTTIDVTFSANLAFNTVDADDFSVTCNTLVSASINDKSNKKLVTLILKSALETSDIPQVTLNADHSINKIGQGTETHTATDPLYITPATALDGSTTTDMTCSLDSNTSTVTTESSTTTVPESDSILSSDDSSNGDSHNHKARPTFGVDHHTFQRIIDGGFTFNGMSFDITGNFWTPFEQQTIKLGGTNMFSAKVFTSDQLMIQEFLFGIPEVGEAHDAELGVEVFYNDDGNIETVNVVQKTDIIDIDTIQTVNIKSKCQPNDEKEDCNITYLFVTFLEPLEDNVMAIKAIDFKNRSQITYLDGGFDVSGVSLNPMNTMMIHGTEKYEGLIEVTRTTKYNDIWESKDGRIFELNDYGTFTWINHHPERITDDGMMKHDTQSDFEFHKHIEIDKATAILNQMCEKCADESYSEIHDTFTHEHPKTFSLEEKRTQQEVEIDKATAILNQMCEKCADESYSEIHDTFTHEHPESFGSRYDNPEVLKILLAEEIRAHELLERHTHLEID